MIQSLRSFACKYLKHTTMKLIPNNVFHLSRGKLIQTSDNCRYFISLDNNIITLSYPLCTCVNAVNLIVDIPDDIQSVKCLLVVYTQTRTELSQLQEANAIPFGVMQIDVTRFSCPFRAPSCWLINKTIGMSECICLPIYECSLTNVVRFKSIPCVDAVVIGSAKNVSSA